MVITVTCPSCATSFPVDSKKVPAAGVNARCSSCRHVFRIERPAEPPPPPPVQAEAPWAPPPPHPETKPAPSFEAPSSRAEDLASGEAAAAQDWVYEKEDQIDAGSLTIQPFETTAEPVPPEPAAFALEPAPPPESAAPEPAPPAVGAFTFGKRDPKDKARRLARVLVSDMIMYNPQRHERALANGTLKQDFEDEIARSWKEYVDQVGEEMATQNPFWADALNDVLAKGQKIF